MPHHHHLALLLKWQGKSGAPWLASLCRYHLKRIGVPFLRASGTRGTLPFVLEPLMEKHVVIEAPPQLDPCSVTREHTQLLSRSLVMYAMCVVYDVHCVGRWSAVEAPQHYT